MPSKWSWIALGAGAYVAFALSSFPAATAYRWFAPEALTLAGIRGTLWSGGAELGALNGVALHDVRWDVRAWPLLIGRLGATLEARLADGFLGTEISATPSRVRLNDLRASTSLPTLRAWLPVQGMQGLASVSLSTLTLEDGWPTDVVGVLRLAQLQVEPFMPMVQQGLISLGDYEVRFAETSGEGLAASFNDTGGPLEVSGTLSLDRSREYMLDATVKPRPNAPTVLLDGLAIMTGEPDAAGRRRLTLTGSL